MSSMKRFLRWFVPHSSNNYHPLILRKSGLILIVLVVAFIPTLYNTVSIGTTQVLGYATDVSVDGLNEKSNQERAKHGLPALTLNSLLSQAAADKAADMFAKDYWAHNAPNGTTPWSFMKTAGYDYSTAGENLAKNFLTSAGVVNGWMNSTTHRANILDADFVDVGYAAVNGILQGEEVTLVVAMYGAPARSVATAPTTSSPTSVAPVEDTTPAASENTPAEATAAESGTPIAGEVLGDIISAPIKAYNQFNWGQKATLFIIMSALLLFVMSHTLLWRAQRRGYRNIWFRAHPLAQATVLGAALVMVLLSGTGVIL